MSDSDQIFNNVWLTALEKFGAEAVFSKDPTPEMNEGGEANNQELLSSPGSIPNTVDPRIGDSNISGFNISDSGRQSSAETPQAGKGTFAEAAGNANFQPRKAEVVGKETMRRPQVTEKEFDTGGQAQSPKSDIVPPPKANQAQDSVDTGMGCTTCHTTPDSLTSKGKQSPSNSRNLLSYIRSREDDPMFSSSRTPSCHSSETRGPVRWIKVNLGDYSAFELADNRFENIGKPRAWNPGEVVLNYLSLPKGGMDSEW